MYDNVNFWINRVDILSGYNPFDIIPFLSDIAERQSEQSGYSCSGKLKNYSANVYPYGISLKGSLAKYHLGNNIETLTRQTVQTALTELSDNLHIDMHLAKITRLDVSSVIQTTHPPKEYYKLLGNKPYFERLQSTPDTLYYNNHQRQIVFYDKTKETRSAGVAIPEIFLSNHLLRYELRYTKRLSKQLKHGITSSILTDKGFYRLVIENWKNEFRTIQKIKNIDFMIDNITTRKEAKDAYITALVKQAGQSSIDAYIARLKAEKKFTDRKYYSRIKSDLNKIITDPKSEQGELLQELEKKIYQTAKYAM